MTATAEQWHAAFLLHLEKARFGADRAEREALVNFAEQELTDAIRRHVQPDFGGLFSETRPDFYRQLRAQMQLPGPLHDENERSGGRLSMAAKQYVGLLQSKYNPLRPGAVRLTERERQAAAHTGQTGQTTATPPPHEDEPLSCVEGAEREAVLTRYERNPRLRRACIAHWGCRCAVCGLDFGTDYGRLGRGYIEVHHLRPIATWKGEIHKVDPTKDLVPLCANCHRMIHRGRERVLTLDELRRAWQGRSPDSE